MASAKATEAAPRGAVAGVHEPVLSRADYELLVGLDEHVPADALTRTDMVTMITQPETLAALAQYEPFFAMAGVDVTRALAEGREVAELQRLRRRLELASSIVQRHIQSKGVAMVDVASAVHKLVAGTPEGGAVRIAFSLFEEQWRAAFPGNGASRAAKTRPGKNDPEPT